MLAFAPAGVSLNSQFLRPTTSERILFLETFISSVQILSQTGILCDVRHSPFQDVCPLGGMHLFFLEIVNN